MMFPSLSSCSSNASPRRRNASPPGRQKASKGFFQRDENYDVFEKEKPPRSFFTAGQAFALAALCSSIAALSTAIVAFYFFSGSFDSYADQLVASTTRSVISRRRVRSLSSSATGVHQSNVVEDTSRSLQTPALLSEASSNPEKEVDPTSLSFTEKKQDDLRPHIAWLMSFPNRCVFFLTHSEFYQSEFLSTQP